MSRLVHGLAVAVISSIIAGGCLSSPKPKGGDGDGGAIDSGGDGDGGMAGSPFPGDREVSVYIVDVLDINGDQIQDMFVVNRAADAGDRGIYIMHGPQSDPTQLEYHQFVNTNVDPYNVRFTEVLGSGRLDAVVIGKPDSGDDLFIEIYAHDPDGTFARVAFKQLSGFQPDATQSPVALEVGALEIANLVANDIIYGYAGDLFKLLLDDATTDISQALDDAQPVLMRRDGTPGGPVWDETINTVFARNLDAQDDDLLVVEARRLTWMVNDGNGNFTDGGNFDGSMAFPVFAFQEVEIAGGPPAEIVGGGFVNFGIWFGSAGSPVDFQPATWTFSTEMDLSDIAYGDLDGLGQPETVVFAPDDTQTIRVFASTTRNASEMNPTTPTTFATPSIRPDHGLIMNFDNQMPEEVWFMQNDGEAGCLTFADLTASPCQ